MKFFTPPEPKEERKIDLAGELREETTTARERFIKLNPKGKTIITGQIHQKKK